MDYFNLCTFVEELKKTFSYKTGRLSLALQGVSWHIDVNCLNGDDPRISKEVDDIVQSTFKRIKFEQKQYRMLFEEVDTPLETVNKRIYLSAMNWNLGLYLVAENWRDGLRLLLKSTELLDMCYGIVEHENWLQAETIKKERASHGGKARAAIYAPLKAEIIRSLYFNKPDDGWKNMQDALTSIDKDIGRFIEQHGCPGSTEINNKEEQTELYSRIPRMIEDWSREDAIVKAAFGATVRQTEKSTPRGAK